MSAEERARFLRAGFVQFAGVLLLDEVAEIEFDYDRFLRREIAVPGKDLCDKSGDYRKTLEPYSIVNAMLPRRSL